MVRKISSLVKTPLPEVKKRNSKKQAVAKPAAASKVAKVSKKIQKPKETKKAPAKKVTQQKKEIKKQKEQPKQKNAPKQKKEVKTEKKGKQTAVDGKKSQKVGQGYQNVRLGFVGIGTIVKSMVKGLCNPNIGAKVAKNIILSPRNEQNAQSLAKEFKQVKVAKTNQEVIDNSDWVIIGLLTTKIPEILKDLKFRKNQIIINLAAMPNERFQECLNDPKITVIRACPLPPIALNVGATIVSPPNKQVEELFNALGSSVAVKTSHETYSLQGIACLMGPQYKIFESCYDWMVNSQKIDPKVAQKYIMGTFHSICVDALDKITNQNSSFSHLVAEQTPGGLNETNLKWLEKKNVFKNYQQVLDDTYKKMTSKK